MRFFEFKTPEPGSLLFQQIQKELSDLVDLAKDLPEDDPVRQKVSDYLDEIKQQTGITEQDSVETAEDDLIRAMAQAMAGSGSTMALLDIRKFKESIKNELRNLGTAHQEKQKVADLETTGEIVDLGIKLSKKLNQPSEWGAEIAERLMVLLKNAELTYEFLDQCLSGSALNWSFGNGVHDFDLRSLAATSESKTVINNPQCLKYLMSKKWIDNKDTGKGEVLLGLMTKASHESKGDIVINSIPYEVKASTPGIKASKSVSDPTAYLDAGPYKSSPEMIKNIFRKLLNQRNIQVDEQLVNMADFRPTTIKYLNQSLEQVTDKDKLLFDLHSAVFPGVDKSDIKKGVDRMLAGNGILNHVECAREQGIMAMKQYAAESDDFGFVFVNAVTLKGTVMVNDFAPHPGFRFAESLTMSMVSVKDSSKTTEKRKSSPGIRIGDYNEARKLLKDLEDTKQSQQPIKSAPATKSPTKVVPTKVVQANDPTNGIYGKYPNAKDLLKDLRNKHGQIVVNDFQSMSVSDFEQKYNLS
jgi:hypothetical protein